MGEKTVYGAGTYRSTTIINQRGGEYWADVDRAFWLPTPSSTSMVAQPVSESPRLRFPLQYLTEGMGIRYKYDGVYRYGIIDSYDYSQNDGIGIRGYPLDVSKDISELAVTSFTTMLHYYVPGAFGDTVDTDLLESKTKSVEYWQGPTSYIVAMRTKYASGTGNPSLNITTADGDIWTSSSPVYDYLSYANAVGVTSNYAVNHGDRIKIKLTSANAGAMDMSMMLVVVPK